MRGDDVKALQQFLAEHSFLDMNNVSGYYGTLTAEAVKEFQSDHGISAVGSVGPLTKVAIQQACNITPQASVPMPGNVDPGGPMEPVKSAGGSIINPSEYRAGLRPAVWTGHRGGGRDKHHKHGASALL